jgi:hypothetical protein
MASAAKLRIVLVLKNPDKVVVYEHTPNNDKYNCNSCEKTGSGALCFSGGAFFFD